MDIASSHITNVGHVVLWVTFAIMTIASIAFATLMFQATQNAKTIPMISMAVTIVSGLAYFAMAASEEGSLTGPYTYRTVYYARYVDWAITTPLLLLELALISGLSLTSTLFVLLTDELMIISGLIGTLDYKSNFRWAWFGFGVVFWLPILKELMVDARRSAHQKSERVAHVFETLLVWTLFLWTLYPVVWTLAIGCNFISSDGEVISYALLDVATKVIFGFSLMFNFATEGYLQLPSDNP